MNNIADLPPGKRLRYAFEVAACRLVADFTSRVPRSVVLHAARCFGALGAVLDRRGRRVALENLECVFGDRFSANERRRMVRQSYQNFILTMLSLFWARQLTPENFRKWMHLEGLDQLVELIKRERRGIIYMCAHQGNWEWASLTGGFLGIPPRVVTANFRNRALTDTFRNAREHSGSEMIPQERSMLRMLKTLKSGGAVGLLADMSFVRNRAATVVDAWGLKMVVPILPAILAQRTGALLVPVTTEPLSDGTCRIVAHPPVETPPEASVEDIAQRCWTVFEHEIDRRPELWLLPYKFFRYRPRGATHLYPAYSNESNAFEKLLKASSSKTTQTSQAALS